MNGLMNEKDAALKSDEVLYCGDKYLIIKVKQHKRK